MISALSLALLLADPSAAEIARRSAEAGAPAAIRETATMTVTDPKGKTRVVGMILARRRGKNGWDTRLEMTSPKDEAGMVLLSLSSGKEQHLWLPGLKRVRRVAGTQRLSSFVGSDFTYEDLSERDSDRIDFTRLPDQDLAGRSCYVIQGVPHPDLETAYGKTIATIAKDDLLTLQVRFLDKAGKELKTLEVDPSRVESRGERRVPRRLEMRSADGHRTVLEVTGLELDPPLDNSLFDPASLDKG